MKPSPQLSCSSLACIPRFFIALAAPVAAANLRFLKQETEVGTNQVLAPQIGQWGFDISGMDRSTNPGDHFFDYANGQYLEHLQIPADKTRWGTFDQLAEQSQKHVREILEADANDGGKMGRFYKSFMDEGQIEARGLEPLQAVLAEVQAMKNHDDFARISGKAMSTLLPSPFGFGVGMDAKDPTMHSLHLGQGGIGLPNRDYYLEASFAEKKAAYQEFAVQMLKLIEWPSPTKAASDIAALETDFAKVHWPSSDLRDPDKTYNPWTQQELVAKAQGFNWDIFLNEAGPFKVAQKLVIGSPSAVVAMSKRLSEADIDTLKAWAAFHVAKGAAPYLSKEISMANFNFYGKTLSGQESQSPRWKRGVGLVNTFMGEAVGEVYVKKHFPPDVKRQAESLTQSLKRAFESRLQRLTWMQNSTKSKALHKLQLLDIQVGHPKKIRNYTSLTINESGLLSNVERSVLFSWKEDLDDLDKPVDRDEWFMNPQDINAYNMPQFNQIVFPAAILQSPFFDPLADEAVNFGAIGAVIGHEMTHGFDDQGRKYDAQGKLADWWTPEDAKEFLKRAEPYGKQFAAYDLGLNGTAHINPALTMGEIIADLGGLNMALDAYRASRTPSTSLIKPLVLAAEDGFEGDRRVFLGWAQVWRGKQRNEALRQLLVTDPHPPPAPRVDIPASNIDAWYLAFNVSANSKLFKDKAERVKIW